MDLVLLAEAEGNKVTVRVLGRIRARLLATEIVVETPFVSGSVRLHLSPSRLEAWGRALDSLDAGEDISWMAVERGPSIFITLAGERDCPEVVVEDEMASTVSVRVPIVPPEDWLRHAAAQYRSRHP